MVRVIIFAFIVSLVAGSVVQGQEVRPPGGGPSKTQMFMVPPQTAPANATTLNILGNTAPGQKDLTHQLVFPANLTRDEAIDACAREMVAFLKHSFPDLVKLAARVATCVVPEVVGDPS